VDSNNEPLPEVPLPPRYSLSLEIEDNVSVELKKAFLFAHDLHPEGGVCLEFGVFKGRTFLWQLHKIITRFPQSRIVGFDSWQGLPAETDGVWCPERHKEGEMSVGENHVRQQIQKLTLGEHEDRYELIPGFFSVSLTENLRGRLGNVIFVNIDVDLHSSTVEVLRFLRPILKPGMILYFDDWQDPQDTELADNAWGEHLAWYEFVCLYPDFSYRILGVNELNQHVIMITDPIMEKVLPQLRARYEKILEIANV
jgi:hypothetical protein